MGFPEANPQVKMLMDVTYLGHDSRGDHKEAKYRTGKGRKPGKGLQSLGFLPPGPSGDL